MLDYEDFPRARARPEPAKLISWIQYLRRKRQVTEGVKLEPKDSIQLSERKEIRPADVFILGIHVDPSTDPRRQSSARPRDLPKQVWDSTSRSSWATSRWQVQARTLCLPFLP